jgi:hypothetical protein
MDETQLRAFVGPSAGYYLNKWSEVNYTSRRNTWSWAGFFFSILWLSYRKMYTLCCLYLLLGLLLIAICLIAECRTFACLTTFLGFQTLIAYFGNRMYFHFVQAKIIEVYASKLNEPEMLELMHERGGTEFAAVIAMIFITAIAVYLLLILFNAVPEFYMPANLIRIIFG